jgi:hypothetical protein
MYINTPAFFKYLFAGITFTPNRVCGGVLGIPLPRKRTNKKEIIRIRALRTLGTRRYRTPVFEYWQENYCA